MSRALFKKKIKEKRNKYISNNLDMKFRKKRNTLNIVLTLHFKKYAMKM